MKVSVEVHTILVKTKVMQQIGVNKCNLLEADGFKYTDACIGYFTMSKQMYEIQINDEDKGL